jgi:hypothetical protein
MKTIDRSNSGFSGALRREAQKDSWSTIVLVVTVALICFGVIGELANANEAEDFLAQPEPSSSFYDGWHWEEPARFEPFTDEGMVIRCWEGDISCMEFIPPVLHEA